MRNNFKPIYICNPKEPEGNFKFSRDFFIRIAAALRLVSIWTAAHSLRGAVLPRLAKISAAPCCVSQAHVLLIFHRAVTPPNIPPPHTHTSSGVQPVRASYSCNYTCSVGPGPVSDGGPGWCCLLQTSGLCNTAETLPRLNSSWRWPRA